MKKSRFSEEQILSILQEAETTTAVDACRKHNISTTTFYQWKARYAGLTGAELRAKRTLEQENARLKALLAEKMLDNELLKEALKRMEKRGKA